MTGPVVLPADPPIESLPAGTELYRVHPARYPADAFHLGAGTAAPVARFSFFGAPTVPALYAADSVDAAISETLLRDVPVDGGPQPLEAVDYRVLSRVVTTRELKLLQLHGNGFRQLGVSAEQVTLTSPRLYPQTVAWGQAARAAGLDGVAWMSRHHNSSRAYVLYHPKSVKAHPGSLIQDFTEPDGWIG